MKVFIADTVAPEAIERLKAAGGIEVDYAPGLKGEDLKRHVAAADGLIVRSATKVTAELIAAAPRLRCVVRAGVGVDTVDVPAASRRGIIVMNTPGGNTLSTAEHTMALLLALSRNVYPACASLKAGQWDRKSFMGTQLAGKTIGVIGLGRIGIEVARRCAAFGMTVVGLDPYMTPERAKELQIRLAASLEEICAQADYLTVHVPMSDETRGLIGAAQIAKMKDCVRIINCARGGIVDEAALAAAIRAGKVAGAALDVYEQEPPTSRDLVDLPQVLCTPHLGASTEEAQVSVAIEAAEIIADALLRSRIRNAVNVPAIDPREAEALAPFVALARCLGAFHVQFLRRIPARVAIAYAGEAAKLQTRYLTAHLLSGLLESVLEDEVNVINAPYLAEERGIRVSQATSPHSKDFATLISVTSTTDGEEHEVAGTIVGRNEPRIVTIDGYRVEAITRGTLLILLADDKPGLIGNVGKVLGEKGINIAAMTFGRKTAGGEAITVLNIDGALDETTLRAVEATPHVRQAKIVTF
ncbi:MAG TPA: phosphoglycerate dehydrogenase [Planctomycetota bacterium]|nr:phosphoglycerate dehydrogenase [Planctomycetota bacterium]HRR80289.1 phosphoglycerate dehydrogenase [Planctomycetota bacterium]HRT95931.1 phosphoglycerate dehydrogenase [Planctomycetota bacterium]